MTTTGTTEAKWISQEASPCHGFGRNVQVINLNFQSIKRLDHTHSWTPSVSMNLRTPTVTRGLTCLDILMSWAAASGPNTLIMANIFVGGRRRKTNNSKPVLLDMHMTCVCVFDNDVPLMFIGLCEVSIPSEVQHFRRTGAPVSCKGSPATLLRFSLCPNPHNDCTTGKVNLRLLVLGRKGHGLTRQRNSSPASGCRSGPFT